MPKEIEPSAAAVNHTHLVSNKVFLQPLRIYTALCTIQRNK
jgi:hypothetical protein